VYCSYDDFLSLFSICFIFCYWSSFSLFYTLSLHDALPIFSCSPRRLIRFSRIHSGRRFIESIKTKVPPVSERHWCRGTALRSSRSEEHTSELQSRGHLVCRLLLEKKNYNLNMAKIL